MPTNEPRAVTLTAEEVAGQKLALLHACEIISHVNAKYPEDMDDADFQKALSILDAAETRGWSLSNKGDHPAKYPISHTIWTDEGKKLRGWRVVGRRGVYWMVAEEVNFTTGEIISWEYLNTIAQCCIQALQENSILAAAEARAREEKEQSEQDAAIMAERRRDGVLWHGFYRVSADSGTWMQRSRIVASDKPMVWPHGWCVRFENYRTDKADGYWEEAEPDDWIDILGALFKDLASAPPAASGPTDAEIGDALDKAVEDLKDYAHDIYDADLDGYIADVRKAANAARAALRSAKEAGR